jgi:hypothetical protein
LIPTPAKPISLAARLCRRCDVVVPGKLAPPHPVAVIDDGQRGRGGIGGQGDLRGTGVQRVRHDLGENRLLDRAGVRIPEVLQEMQQIDSRLTHERQAP